MAKGRENSHKIHTTNGIFTEISRLVEYALCRGGGVTSFRPRITIAPHVSQPAQGTGQMNETNAAGATPMCENAHLLKGPVPTVHDAYPDQQQTTRRILVVEDDLTLAALETEILAAYGYSVVCVPSGERAMALFHHSIPDLVVLDLELTGNVNGWEVLQALRAISSIPVLITTSVTTTVRTCLRSCGESRFTLDHLPKPYPMQTLLKRVKRMLPIVPTSRPFEA